MPAAWEVLNKYILLNKKMHKYKNVDSISLNAITSIPVQRAGSFWNELMAERGSTPAVLLDTCSTRLIKY